MSLICKCSSERWKPLGNQRRWDTYIIKAFSGRFGFDDVRTSQLQTVSQKQSNGNAPWGVICLCSAIICLWHWYIYIIVGLSALLGLNYQGNAKTFTSWNRATDWLHVFYILNTDILIIWKKVLCFLVERNDIVLRL